MKNYKVQYAGLQDSLSTIQAATPKEAALSYFSGKPLRLTVIVKTGWFKEVTFTCEELVRDIDGININDIEKKQIKRSALSTFEIINEMYDHYPDIEESDDDKTIQ